ncbi:hypothetical protein GCM10023211_21630 [Orbus sasakiae]|uniref:Uncharacterized protein n=1 Tax=Orbus sasakiae TaxID=1078475 RepID=A0ABP9NB52_9GAMM
MAIQETPQAKAQRMNNLEHIRACRELIVNDRSLARLAFERLSPNQKRYLLIASGLETDQSSWSQLSDSDVKKLSVGIKRLQIIVNQFVNCKKEDFQKVHIEAKKMNCDLHRQLQQRADLVAHIAKGANHVEQSNDFA